MKQPNTARNKGNGGPPPSPPADEPDDFSSYAPLALATELLTMVREGRDPEVSQALAAGMFEGLDALVAMLGATADPALLTPIQKLSKDLKEAARVLGKDEARFLVDAYYGMQENRIRSAHQLRTLTEGAEPHDVIAWLQIQEETLERQIKSALDYYSLSDNAGVWARSVKGIGPVIAAGLLANIDITRAPTVGHIWRFAGQDPTSRWEKGQKRPWNASLKRLCFLIGESFTKVSNRPDDTYGKIYKLRKEYENARNEKGLYADQAKAALEAKKFGRDTDAFKHYTAGRLPPARIHLRSKRKAVKIFLAHFHEVLFWEAHKQLPPFPYVFDHMEGHVHRLEVPNLELIPGLLEAKLRAGPLGYKPRWA